MIGLLTRFVERRQRPLAVLATAIGSTYLALSYIKAKLADMHDSLSRNQETTENLRRRFHQNQDDCLFTVTALVPTLGKQIVESLNVERLTELLNQTKKSRPVPATPPVLLAPDDHHKTGDLQQDEEALTRLDPSTTELTKPDALAPPAESVAEVLLRPDGTALRKRSEIWKEVMVLSFTRLFTCIYAIALLTMQTHIQLGLLGRDAYLSSLINTHDPELDDPDPDQLQHALVDPDTEQRYLTFSWWYLHRGWKLLAGRVRSAVEDVLSRKSLKEDICMKDLSQIFTDIRYKVEQNSDGQAFSFSEILLPCTKQEEIETLKLSGMISSSITEEEENFVINLKLRDLLNQTQDFISCFDFVFVFKKLIDRSMSKTLENLEKKLCLGSHNHQQEFMIDHPRFEEIKNNEEENGGKKNHSTIRFVTILPIVSRESLNILNSLPNEYTEVLSSTDELKEFSSVIYTSFDISS